MLFRMLAVLPLLALCASASAEPPSFKRDIAPLLLNNCLACHGPKKSEGAYRIDTFERIIAAGDSTQPGFMSKDLEGSEALRRVVSTDPKERMPLEGDPLPPEQVALLKAWVEAGLPFDGPDAKAPIASYIPPPTHPASPKEYRATMPVTAVEFAPANKETAGKELFVGGYYEVLVWEAPEGKLLRRIPNMPQRTYALRHSPDGKLLAVAGGTPGKYGEVRLIKPDSGELVRVLGMTSDVVFDCAFNPAGDRLATAAADGVVRVFEVESGNEERTITSHSDWVFAVAWNADGSQLATGSRDKTAKVFDVKTGELLITYNGHNQPVRGVAFHPDGKRVYSAGSDGKLHLWNIADGKKAGDMPGIGGEAYKLTAAGDWLFTSSIDKNVRQFDAKEDKLLRELKGASDWVLSTSLDAPNKRLAGGTFDGQVFLWNIEDGKLITSFYAAPGYQTAKK